MFRIFDKTPKSKIKSRGSFILGTSTEKNYSFPIPFEVNARGFPGYQYVKSTWRLSCGLEDLINLLS